MNYQIETLPPGAKKIGSTPTMAEETVVPGILKKHLTPRGRFGYLVVEEGALQFVWEDDVENVLDADPEHPIVIFPERFHHVAITGKVRFRVEFYEVGSVVIDDNLQQTAERPGEDYI
jgi:tellurite resistance-related uncharacterized protein